MDRVVDLSNFDPPALVPGRVSSYGGASPRPTPAIRGAFSAYFDTGTDETNVLKSMVEGSGAIALTDAGITLLSDYTDALVGKERVPFVSSSGLDKLVVNALIVVYVP